MANTTKAVVVDRARVKTVYSGRPGCACGCRGKYSTNPATITRIVNTMNQLGAKQYAKNPNFAYADVPDKSRTYTAYFVDGY